MTNRIHIIVIICLILLAALGGSYLFEYYQEEKDLGWGREARRNPFLAAVMLAEHWGLEVNSYDSFQKIDNLDEIETLFVSKSGQILSEQRLQELMSWVAEGGILVVGAQGAFEWRSDRLLSYFDFYTYNPNDTVLDFFEDDDADSSDPHKQQKDQQEKLSERLRKMNQERAENTLDEKPQALSDEEIIRRYEEDVNAQAITTLRFSKIEPALQAEFSPQVAFSHPSMTEDSDEQNWSDHYDLFYWTGDDEGVHFAQIRLGSGLVTLLSDASLFDSSRIAYFDHAYLWQVLVEGGKNLTILYGSDMPGLWTLLKHFMPEMLIAFAIFLLAWLWHKLQRFGAIKANTYQVRRSLTEHILASASYLWRGGWQQQLLLPVQKDILHRAETTIPAWSSASDQEKYALLANTAKLTEQQVASVMNVKHGLDEDSFTKTVNLLQKIKESL